MSVKMMRAQFSIRNTSNSSAIRPSTLRQLCYSQCASEYALYFGLLEGIICGCGNTDGFLSSEQEFGICDLSCGGSESETCGGALAYDLYQLEGIDLNPSGSDQGTSETVRYQMLAPQRTSPNPQRKKDSHVHNITAKTLTSSLRRALGLPRKDFTVTCM